MIPDFNLNKTLPPFRPGTDPVDPSAVAPYETTPEALVRRFATSNERATIARGLFDYRAKLRNLGITDGFQWIDGSFVEDCESIRNRPPGDVDIVTFAHRPAAAQQQADWDQLVRANLAIFDPDQTKAVFNCDAYFVDLDLDSIWLVKQATYWFGLFSHQRASQLWKGMLALPLLADDAAAIALLNGGSNAP